MHQRWLIPPPHLLRTHRADPAEIIERKADPSASSFLYYVHYADSEWGA